MKIAKLIVLVVVLACCVGVAVYVLRQRPAPGGRSPELRSDQQPAQVEQKYGVTSETVSP